MESDMEVVYMSISRNLRNRSNPFEMFTDEEFKVRYHFNKGTVMYSSEKN